MQMNLNDIVTHIDDAMGEPEALVHDTQETPNPELEQFLTSDAFSQFLSEHTHREIIRNYLINAIIQGHFPLSRLPSFKHQLASSDGRANLALSMLMCATADANTLQDDAASGYLAALTKPADRHIRLVDPDNM